MNRQEKLARHAAFYSVANNLTERDRVTKKISRWGLLAGVLTGYWWTTRWRLLKGV